MNRIAPVILVVLLAVAVVQLRSGIGGGGVITEGEVSEADLLEETTTTLAQRTFVPLSPLPDAPEVETTRRRVRPTATIADGDPSPTTGRGSPSPTTDPASPSTATGSTVTQTTGTTRPGSTETTTGSTADTTTTSRRGRTTTTRATTPTSPATTGTVTVTTDRPPTTQSTTEPPGNGG